MWEISISTITPRYHFECYNAGDVIERFKSHFEHGCAVSLVIVVEFDLVIPERMYGLWEFTCLMSETGGAASSDCVFFGRSPRGVSL